MISFRSFIALLFIGAPSLSFAACKFYDGHSQKTITISIPSSLTLPRDAPNGTIIYQSPDQTFQGAASFQCSTEFTAGVKNRLGTQSSTSSVFPIGTSGLSWQWIFGSVAFPGLGGRTYKAGGYGHNNTTHALRIMKTGDITPGASIPAGVIGFWQAETLETLAMQIDKSSSIIPQSCETPDVKVEMGQFDLGVFYDIGDTSKATEFSIQLNNCPSGINKVMYSLVPNPTTPAWDAGQGIIELNKTSTAKGIALQILDGNQTPLELKKDHVFSDYTSTGGNFRIPLSARYYRTLPASSGGEDDLGVRPGTANSEVSFVMSYL
ncbi:fimbrial protein [Pseudomonas donghuensis]|uniref:fimbrial protein n=1 Tax=Pseudomonas donghuensis TaxID=1163398 RepID=UPI0020C449E8|nr:fimbrial protein [Pseudomonas donghuensis]MCP6691386.1 type 1 fimbrial protein [Pseudomonas donghuensis]